MKMKKWVKCLLMTMALMMAINVGAIATTIPAAAKAKTATVKNGTKFWKGNLQYKVTSLKGKKGTATLIGAKSKVTSVSVPKTVKTGKYTLTVTAIGDNAFKGCKKLEKVATNTVITKIGKNVFKGCAKLTTVEIKSTKLKSVNKNALKGIAKTAVVKVPDGKDASYEKLLKVSVVTSAEEKAARAAEEAEAKKQETTPAPAAPASAPETVVSAPKETEAKAVPEPTVEPTAEPTPAPKKVETEAAPKKVETEAAPKEAEPTATPEPTVEPTAEPTPTPAPKKAETEAAPKETEPTVTPEPTVEPTAEPTPAPKKVETEAAPKETEATATPEPTVEPTAEPTPAPKKVETEAAPKETEPTATPEPTVEPTAEPIPAPKKVETEAAPKPTVEPTAEPTPTPAPKKAETEAAPKPTVEPTAEPTPAPIPKKARPKAAPKETEPTATPEPTVEPTAEPTPAPKKAETEAAPKPTVEPTAEPTPKEAEPAVCGTKHLGLVVVESVAPTCTEPGSSSYEYCTVCGYKTEPIPISALGHELVHHAEIPATCTTAGQTAYDTCARCDYATASQTIEPLGHSYGDWAVVEEATCTASGTEEKTCATCGAKETRTVAAKGHTLGEATIEPIPGSAYYGRVVRRCTACDYVEKSNYSVHRTDVYLPLEDIPATCTQPGRINRSYCPHCNEERFSYVKPLGHKYSDERTYEEGTCVKAGISYRKCVREGCNARIDVRETEKAGGHQWEDYTVAATCTHSGFEGRKCKLCGELDGEEKGALGHKYETTIVEATCVTNGMKKDVCSVCHDTRVETLAPIGDHQWVEHPAEEATCVEDGHSEYTQCSVCGEYKDGEPEIYAANGQHTWVPDVAACNFMSLYSNEGEKCNCEGMRDGWNAVFKKCENCWTKKIDTVLQGHNWENKKNPCKYVETARENSSNNYDKMSFFILSASFLIEKTNIENLGWSVPEDSANVDVFDVKIGDTDYVCVDMRRRAEGLFIGSQGRANDVKLSDGYTWAPVKGIYDGKIEKEYQYVGNRTPFCMADHRVFVAVSKDECGGWTEMNIQKNGNSSQTESDAADESVTESETDLAAPDMEEIAADAEETPQVVHGEMHLDLFGTTTPTVDDPGHEAHDVTHHEDPLVEPESTMSQGTELAG